MNKTLKYYEDNAKSFIQDTLDKDMSLQYQSFLKHIKKDALILDAGCGSGRDALYFKNIDFRVEAFDASKEMCDYASSLLNQEVRQLRFEDLDFKNEFDAIWASASLLHVSKEMMPSVLQRCAKALKKEGLIYASFKEGDKEFIKEDRYFNSYSKKSFTELIKVSPFEIQEIYSLEDSRQKKEGEYWLNVILVLNNH